MEPEQSKSNESIEINKYFILRALAVRGQIESMMGAIIEDVVAKLERGTNVSVLDGLPPAALA